jgi:hypothetical protein
MCRMTLLGDRFGGHDSRRWTWSLNMAPCRMSISFVRHTSRTNSSRRTPTSPTSTGLRYLVTHRNRKVLSVLTDGRALVVESSANLRSCSSIEQITMTHEAGLLTFHRKWIDELLSEKASPHLSTSTTWPAASERK